MDNRGGADQQARMIKDKKRSLDRALLYSYQGANIRRSGEETSVRGLINPNKINDELMSYSEFMATFNQIAFSLKISEPIFS